MGIVKAICISEARGTEKHPVDSVRVTAGWGIEGDAHGGGWHRQISLLSYDKIKEFNERGADVSFGAFGENLVAEGFDFKNMPVGTLFQCGGAVLELTQIGKECHSHCEIYQRMGDCIMPREGVFARVLQSGTISAGDEITIKRRDSQPLRAAVITASDKAAAGRREDQSGPLAAEILSQAGYAITETLILPDDQAEIETALKRIADAGQTDLIVTTGGTGFSPRDVTPEATMAAAHRNAPGIAEAIRAYSLTITKRAMLSRGVSVLRGKTLIINLPGSPKAVAEALVYILSELSHGITILRGEGEDCAGNP